MAKKSVMRDERAFTITEAAKRLSLSHWTIRDWIYRKRISSTKIGRRRLVPESEIRRLIREGLTERRDVA